MTISPPPRSLLGALLLLVLLALAGLASCQASNGEAAHATPSHLTSEATAPPTSTAVLTPTTAPSQDKATPPGEPAQDKAPPVDPMQDKGVSADLYPDIPLGLLKPEQRAAVVRITKAQLCPCPQSAESLHQCMQRREGRCDLAVRATQEGMRKLHEGTSEGDALDAVGSYIENALKKYTFNLDRTPMRGSKNAKVVIVEFADFECPFCNRARALIKAALDKHPEHVAIYFKQFPLSFHKNSGSAAAASLAAYNQGRFWEMYDLLFDNQTSLSDAKITEFAQGLGLNIDTFNKDWKSPATGEWVQRQSKEGDDADVTSTPTFFINGRRYVGDFTPEAFVQAVEAEL